MEQIHQNLSFPVGADVLFNTLINEKEHAAFTGSGAKIDPVTGGNFMAYDGYIVGEILELQPGRLIRQSWQAMEETWPDGHYSIVTFRITGEGDKCSVDFTHENIPKGQADRFAEGWTEHYWEKLLQYFDGR